MLSALVYALIFIGVTVTLYQLYAVNYAINFDNHKKLSNEDWARLETLKAAAADYQERKDITAFGDTVERTLGETFDKTLALEAFSHESNEAAMALLRRRARLRFGSRLTVRHPLLGTTPLPKRDWRALFISLVILNSLIAQFLGGMSIYTLLYRVETPALEWLNEPVILMVLIFLLVPLNYLIEQLDFYLNDLYRINRLERGTQALEAYS
ncbi:hypothetical protein [Vreelandella sp. EE22]